jgi:hypothetical protein
MAMDIGEACVHLHGCYCDMQHQRLMVQHMRKQQQLDTFERGIRLIGHLLND